MRLPAAFSDGGAWGVAAVCRRPVKDPPRQFGERAFPGFPCVLAASCVFSASVLIALYNSPMRGPPSLPVNPSPVNQESYNRKVL